MSGPKIDYAELERQRQAELERQRKERLRQIKMATDELNVQLSIARKNQASVESDSARLISSLSSRSEMQDVLFKISEIKKEHQKKVSSLLNESVPTEADDIRAMAKRIAEKTADVYEEYSISVKPYVNRLKSFIDSENEAAAVRSFVVTTKSTTISAIETFDFRAAIETIEENSDICEQSKHSVDETFNQLEQLINSDSVALYSKKELLLIADELYKAAFEGESSVSAKIVECDVLIKRYQNEQNAFEDLYNTYYSEYVAYLETINTTRDIPLKIVPKEMYSFKSIDELSAELSLLQELSRNANEQGYIRQQIDEVLREFGYNTSEEIILNRTQRDPHLISRKKDGNIGIHIHLSDRGEIMMEVVGVGETQRTKSGIENSIRVPSAELSEEQKNQLLSEQQAFCSMHPKIVEKLRERGIILNTRMHKEPSLQYALMILNMVGEEEALIDASNIINIQEGDEHRIVRHKQEERAIKR